MPRSNPVSAVEILEAVGQELRAAVVAEDFDGAAEWLRHQENAFRQAVESEDAAALLAASGSLLQACLHMVRMQRQNALDEYSRLANASAYSTPRATGTWGLSG